MIEYLQVSSDEMRKDAALVKDKNMVMVWLMNSIDSSISLTIAYYSVARDMGVLAGHLFS